MNVFSKINSINECNLPIMFKLDECQVGIGLENLRQDSWVLPTDQEAKN